MNILKLTRLSLFSVALLAGTAVLAGCEEENELDTSDGLEQDMENAEDRAERIGEDLERSAENAGDEIEEAVENN